MRRTRARLFHAVLAAGVTAAVAPIACGQVATFGKGYQHLINNGLQIWGLDQGAVGFNYNNLANANFNGVVWSFGIDEDNSKLATLSSGQKWGKWVDASGSPTAALDAFETSRIADLVALQIGDEQQSDIENPNGVTKAWFQAAHAGNHFPNQLLYVNSFFIGSDAAYATFIANANPDAISFDSYPFDNPYGSIIFPHNWLSKAGQFRRHALSSYLGIGGNTPRPYGMYLQTYESTSEGTRHPGEVEMRWQQFTAWTMGFTFVDAFTVGGSSSLFSGSNMSSPTEPRYSQFAETSRQSLNLGPALTRLISHGYGPSIVVGKDSAGTPNIVPSDWLVFNKTNAPANQQYLTSISATNIGTKNNAQPGDVYVGFFNPLHTSFGNTAGTTYFMVTNALGPYLNDPTALVVDCRQEITLNFDFGASGITQLLRLSRETGAVEFVPLGHISGSLYSATLTLDGGTGDLLKFDDGQPFVGVGGTGRPPVTPMIYWDADANASNNNLGTGAGLGGSGSWAAANRWYNGSTNGGWVNNNHAVFWGSGGTVTLASPQSSFSLNFKSTGYNLSGSTLTLYGPNVNVDSGSTATISSVVAGGAGIDKTGGGTLILSNTTNIYNGPTRVSGGVLRVSADGGMGKAPTTLATSIALDGGTLQFGASFDINNNRGIMLGAGGGTIDTQGFTNPAGYTQHNGISGSGNLTKMGSGTFFMNTASGQLNNGWTGNLILKEGTWKITERGGLPFNPPQTAVSPVIPGQITFDGGTLQIAGAIPSVTNGRRGITVAAGGGTFDTQGFTFNWAGPLAGNDSSAVFTKTGSGMLQFNSNAVPAPSTFAGSVNVAQGVFVINNNLVSGNATASLPLASIDLANNAGATFIASGTTVTIGSLSGGGAAGGHVSLNVSLNTGGNNNSTTYNGILFGSGGLIKTGSGTFTLAPPANSNNTYAGGTTINGGKLLVNNTIGSGTGLGSVTVNAGAALGGTGAISGTVTVNSGGHIAPGASIESLIVGSLTLAAGSILDFELDTVLGVDTSDLLNVTSTNGLTINGGTLNLTNAGAMTNGTYTLIDYAGTLNGSLSNITLGTTPPGFSYNLVNNATNRSIDLVVAAPDLAGDFNGDGMVDAADYVVWRKGLGTTYTQVDFDTWRRPLR